jgi:hypothetical protein
MSKLKVVVHSSNTTKVVFKRLLVLFYHTAGLNIYHHPNVPVYSSFHAFGFSFTHHLRPNSHHNPSGEFTGHSLLHLGLLSQPSQYHVV